MAELIEIFGINWKLLLAQVINFGLVLAVLWYFLYRPITDMLEKRRVVIEEGLRKAAEATVRLERAHDEEREIIQKASLEAEYMVKSARVRAEEKGDEVLQSAHTRAESILEDAAARAEETQRRAMNETEKEIARTAILAAEKVLRKKSKDISIV